LKKDKHQNLRSNYMVYAVPGELKEQAKEYIIKNIPYASLIASTKFKWTLSMKSTALDMETVIKRKKLHNNKIPDKDFRFCAEQLMCRYIGKYARLNEQKEWFDE